MTCPDSAGCPVLEPELGQVLQPCVIEAQTSWFNVTRHDQVFNRSGAGDSRFAPLFDPDGRPVPYVYVAQNPVGALLESVLHDVWGVASTVQRSDLRGCRLRRLTCETDIRVVDLRDVQLDQNQISRQQLVSSPSEHYGCTRRWAALQRSQDTADGEPAAGFIWNSRQLEVAATHASNLLQVLLTAAEQISHIAVVYDTADTGNVLFTEETMFDDLGSGDGLALTTELCVKLGLHIEN